MPSDVVDQRRAQSYSTVGTSRSARKGGHPDRRVAPKWQAWARRAHRCEKTSLGAVHRRPQQTACEICRLDESISTHMTGDARSLALNLLVFRG